MPILPNKPKKKSFAKKFEVISARMSSVVGSPFWFIFSVSIVFAWLLSGPFFNWGETWQLIINTTTTILTFIMMSLLHSSQSKWEDRMEKLQQKERTNLMAIEKTTKKLAYDKGERPIGAKQIEAEEKIKELVDSLH